MNLAELRVRVEREQRHAPNVQAHVDDLTDLINDAYLALMDREMWDFRIETLNVHPYSNGARSDFPILGDRTVTITANDNSKEVAFSGLTPALPTAYPYDGELLLAGHTLEAPSGNRYMINNVLGTNLVLAQPWHEGSVVDGPATIRFLRWVLPTRVADVMRITLRKPLVGELMCVERTEEARQFLLSPDDTGSTPLAFLRENMERIRGPIAAPTVGTTIGPGIPAGTYRHRYCFAIRGILSPPSAITETVTTEEVTSFDISGLEQVATANEGWAKILYREDNRSGLWFPVAGIGDNVGTYTDNTVDPAQAAVQESADEDVYLRPGFVYAFPMYEPWNGEYLSFRLYPRPAADLNVEILALTRPRRLLTDGDCPAMPDTYHPIIVHNVMERLAGRFGAGELRALHEKWGNELESRMRARCLEWSAKMRERRGWRPWTRRFVPISITFGA